MYSAVLVGVFLALVSLSLDSLGFCIQDHAIIKLFLPFQSACPLIVLPSYSDQNSILNTGAEKTSFLFSVIRGEHSDSRHVSLSGVLADPHSLRMWEMRA